MYKYTVKKSLRKRAAYYYPGSRSVTYAWFHNNIAPLIPDYNYVHWTKFREIDSFTFYSPKQVREVPMGGIMFPAALFDMEEV